jgi:hypothetical protein
MRFSEIFSLKLILLILLLCLASEIPAQDGVRVRRSNAVYWHSSSSAQPTEVCSDPYICDEKAMSRWASDLKWLRSKSPDAEISLKEWAAYYAGWKRWAGKTKDRPSWEEWLSVWPSLKGQKKVEVLESFKRCSDSGHNSQFNDLRLIEIFVMGKDDRSNLTYEENQVPEFQQVGLISGKMVSLGTSFVTGKNCDVVITAGHVVVNSHGEIKSKEDGKFFKFHEDFNAGKADRYTKMSIVDTGFLPLGYKGFQDEDDWAILRPDEPAFENCQPIPFTDFEDIGSECGKEGALVTVGTHKGDFKNKKIVRNCSMLRSQLIDGSDVEYNKVIKNDCDIGTYGSGSPLYCKGADGNLTLIGVQVGGESRLVTDDEIDSQHERFGQPGLNGHPLKHFNTAVSIWGKFGRALKEEMRKSEMRFGK